jgi:phospholipid/cholesterol/gamma-HCH transport system ATP-binding protein
MSADDQDGRQEAPPARGGDVVLDHVRMAFGSRRIFDDLSCRFPGGAISVILGGSGSGKSTMLKLIGGLLHPLSGRVLVGGQDVSRISERGLYAVREQIGMMFQAGALLDSLTVFDNLAFPLREHTTLGRAQIRDCVHAKLAAVGLSEGEDRLLPGQLSGGMLKRVALARAIMRDPRYLLCDEPFSGLDTISARRIERLLGDLNRRLGMTTIVISHDVPSTLRIADHVLVLLRKGAVQGTPDELRASTDPLVANLISADVDEAVLAEKGVEGSGA